MNTDWSLLLAHHMENNTVMLLDSTNSNNTRYYPGIKMELKMKLMLAAVVVIMMEQQKHKYLPYRMENLMMMDMDNLKKKRDENQIELMVE